MGVKTRVRACSLRPVATPAHELIELVIMEDLRPVVQSWNEWDLLEEVIVGVLDGASIPPWHVAIGAAIPADQETMFRAWGGRPFGREQVDAGRRDLEGFVHILAAEGVTVRRPDVLDHGRPYATPDWAVAGGLYAAMPRDVALVVGDEIIEAPMAWRSRSFEIHAYRSLFMDYFHHGARWTAAPRPRLEDELYDEDYERRERLVVTEREPTFDAADFFRCGRDVFGQRSHVTNAAGIAWLRRHLGPAFRVHELHFYDPHPMHIDATFMPLAPGKVLCNPERVRAVPEMFRGWEMIEAPPPAIPEAHPMYLSSRWVSMNILMLDERRVVVEAQEEELQRVLRGAGFTVIPCGFRGFNTFGGSFHCATLDVRRRGGPQTYF
jgi:glycine amidinotransferase